jgi:hypothetical protein
MWLPTAERFTTASEDARPGSAASPLLSLEPSTRHHRRPKGLAGVSKLAGIVILGLDPVLTLLAITIGTLKGHSTLTAVQWVGSRYMVRPTSYSLAHT